MKQIHSEPNEVLTSTSITECRGCQGAHLRRWFDLGRQPLANNLLSTKDGDESVFPLRLVYCEECGLVQLEDVVNPDLMFGDYLYQSSTSPVFVKHFEDLAHQLYDLGQMAQTDLVVDIGSNDGILLKPFKKRGVQVLGVEPCERIARVALEAQIPTLPLYFNRTVAEEIVKTHGKARLVTMTNVFAHVHDVDEIVEGVKILLAENGQFMVEVPYLPQMLDEGTFDLIYHEHLSYFDIDSMQRLLKRLGMRIKKIEMVPVHGGSMRVFSEPVSEFKPWEEYPQRDSLLSAVNGEWFQNFQKRIDKNLSFLADLLKPLDRRKYTIIGYGAPAKLSTLTNYRPELFKCIEKVIDDAPEKQGKFTPGLHIPIVPMKSVDFKKVDYIFIFAWNFADSIMDKVRAKGFRGKFIIPYPKARVQ